MDEQYSLERGRRMRKLKLQHHGEEERIAEEENPRKLCRICKKEFDNGKALGGHMRVHAQESSSQRSINGGEFISPEKITPVCNVCGKAFHSWKSLYGHMRCHSGPRNGLRRGVDLLRHVAGWPVTGKRGRGSSIPAPEMDIMEAAQNLLWLATGPRFWISESCFVLVDDFRPGNCCLEPKNGSGSELKSNTVEKKKRGRKKKVKVEIKDPISNGYPDLIPGPVGGFHCVTCSKEFSTYQALGGHRSKHYKERINGVQSCFCNPGPGPENGSNWAEGSCI